MADYNLHVRIPPELHAKVQKAVETQAKKRYRSPKRFKSEWVLEAVLEKLEREGQLKKRA